MGVIHERLSSTIYTASGAMDDIQLERQSESIPSLTELGLFGWNRFVVLLHNAAVSSSVVFAVVFWFVTFPNTDRQHTVYEVAMEAQIHGVVPLLILFDFAFSSRSVLHRDVYHSLLIGTVYC